MISRVPKAVVLLISLYSVSALARMPERQDSKSIPRTNSWLDLLLGQQESTLAHTGWNQFKNDALTFYEMVSGDKETFQTKKRKEHAQHGALRSGEGSPDMIRHRQQQFEEKQMLDDMEARGEYSTDLRTSKKQFEHWKEKMANKRTFKQDNRFDFVPEETVLITEDFALNLAEITGEHEGGRQLSTVNDQGELVIHRLEEPYPTECYSHGQMAKQTQKYYMCKNVQINQATGKPKEAFRVSRETYQYLLANHSDSYSCYTQNTETNVCVCPKGQSDFECATATYQKCYLNITSPAFYQGCEDREDTPYYLYSVPGYSPCYFLDFTTSYTVEFTINCKTVDQNGLVSVQREEVGYEYRDVIVQPEFVPFSYVSQNEETSFTLLDPTEVQVALDFRDMKYLSHKTRFQDTYTDAGIIDGTKTGQLEIDFRTIVDADSTGDAHYVVGGRVYFEAAIFGNNLNSFTYKGFFDQKDYVEPKSSYGKAKEMWIWITVVVLVLGIAGGIVGYCYYKKKQTAKAQAKVEKIE